MSRSACVVLLASLLLAHERPAHGGRCPLEFETSTLTLERVRRVGGGAVPAEVDAYWRDATAELRARDDDGVGVIVDGPGEGSREVRFAAP